MKNEACVHTDSVLWEQHRNCPRTDREYLVDSFWGKEKVGAWKVKSLTSGKPEVWILFPLPWKVISLLHIKRIRRSCVWTSTISNVFISMLFSFTGRRVAMETQHQSPVSSLSRETHKVPGLEARLLREKGLPSVLWGSWKKDRIFLVFALAAGEIKTTGMEDHSSSQAVATLSQGRANTQ